VQNEFRGDGKNAELNESVAMVDAGTSSTSKSSDDRPLRSIKTHFVHDLKELRIITQAT
jgi:hypothetical protein